MRIANFVMGFLLTLAVGYLIGHRNGVQDGMRAICQELDEIDTDHSMLREFWAKVTKPKEQV